MKSCKVFSVIIAAFSFLLAPLLYAEISSECFSYHPQSDHYKTCRLYDKSKVKVLSGITDLNEVVNNAQEGELLIIPARNISNPYLLTEPLELKNGMGLLSTDQGAQGNFYVAPGLNFSIGDSSVYSLVKMAEGSVITGLGIDARMFSAAAIRTFKKQAAVKKTLVYAEGINQFALTWTSLYGRAGLASTIWSDSEYSVVVKGTYMVGQNWLESSGAENVAIFAGCGDYQAEVRRLKSKVDELTGEVTWWKGEYDRVSGGLEIAIMGFPLVLCVVAVLNASCKGS